MSEIYNTTKNQTMINVKRSYGQSHRRKPRDFYRYTDKRSVIERNLIGSDYGPGSKYLIIMISINIYQKTLDVKVNFKHTLVTKYPH